MFDSILDGDTTILAKATRESPECGNLLMPLLNKKGQSLDFLREKRTLLCRNIPEVRAPLDDFLQTVSILDDLGIKYQINIASGTGFEYYTGIIFQFFTGTEKIGGGGRYDALISAMGGGDVPASGFAIYLDRVMSRIKTETVALPTAKRILIKALSGVNIKEAFKIAKALRQAGYIAEIDLDGQKADWTLEIKSAAMMTLTNKAKSQKTSARSVNEVIKLLEGQGDG